MTFFLQNVINALSLGSLYALLALGIALIFGIMRLVNFAYGELLMVGGYAIHLVTGAPWVVFFVAALVVTAIFAVGMERVAFRPVRGAPEATLLVTSFAVSYFLQHLALLVMGSEAQAIVYPQVVLESIRAGGLQIAKLDIITVVTTLVSLTLLGVFLKKGRLGVQMRAAADDFLMTRLLGISANTVIAVAFLVSGLLAGVVSVLYLAQLGTVVPNVGLTPLLVGVVATVIGGLGSLVGAALGGYILGLVSVMLQAYLPVDVSVFRDAFVFGIVILILLLRPQGLLVMRAQVPRV
jgi:branched-chain amino acid transport system permease protein